MGEKYFAPSIVASNCHVNTTFILNLLRLSEVVFTPRVGDDEMPMD
jgi:hypothetical protein